MKHSIGVPSVLTGRQARWRLELTAVREEIQAPDGAVAKPAPVVARRGTHPRRIALATAAGLVATLIVARYFVSGEEYDPADAFFASEAATLDHGSTAEPIVSAPPVAHSAPAVVPPVASPATAPVTPPAVRPIAARKTVAATTTTLPGRRIKTVEVSAPRVEASAPKTETVAMPAIEAREPEKATVTAADARATEVAPLPAPAVTTVGDEVTITGCLEIDADQGRFRLADTEGASAPKARSWRSGFLKKRSAAVDLVGSIDALSHQQAGQRIAATGVLTSRTLKVSSTRVLAPACN